MFFLRRACDGGPKAPNTQIFFEFFSFFPHVLVLFWFDTESFEHVLNEMMEKIQRENASFVEILITCRHLKFNPDGFG